MIKDMEDKKVIDQLIADFFSIFTNTNGHQPPWDTIYRCCIPEAIIIKKSKPEHIVYCLDSFIEPRKTILSNGTLTEFSESEISEETTIFGNIAQRHSRYQKTGYLNGVHFHEYGHKLFQFIKDDGSWRISAVVWEDE
jgi:hypothetical protein